MLPAVVLLGRALESRARLQASGDVSVAYQAKCGCICASDFTYVRHTLRLSTFATC